MNNTKGDWIQLFHEDFELIGEHIDEENIVKIPKEEYRKIMKEKVHKAAFNQLIELKQKSKTKMKDVDYDKFEMQSYMKSSKLNLDEIRLLFALRSKSYPAKMNYKKMNKGNLKCTFLCDSEETQDHIFESCQPIQSRISYPVNVNLKYIYGTIL